MIPPAPHYEPESERRTPDEWLELLRPGWTIIDPDGWRMKDAPPFDEPITEREFGWRFNISTVRRPAPVHREEGKANG